ncbi:hypothetical protein [Hymenobacter sp. BT491]|uniref:hypothetical protein n=1 Tax=Hymenobacter sp. BT491 TaxID=2766779 RepID=UPI0016534ECE|nr:hypothetical protein [Hymenobacter sp. BT491]MBC6992521.1 hypothetical protein [Hymenobacter sp. BT491]
MAEYTITICYRKIINAASAGAWDKLVFEDTYAEFRLQAQNFNPERKYRSFGELLHHAPGAEQLHFLVSAAVRGYLQQLNGLVPEVLNNLGRHFLKFSKFQFEILNSDLLDKAKHQVAINFYSEPLVWHETVGTYLLVSEKQAGGEVLTNMLQLQPYVTIHSLHTTA